MSLACLDKRNFFRICNSIKPSADKPASINAQTAPGHLISHTTGFMKSDAPMEFSGFAVAAQISGVRRKFSWGFQRAKNFLCTKIKSMIRKNIKQAAIQYVNVVKQL